MYLSISRKKMVARQLLSLMFFCFESSSSYVNVNLFPSEYVNISTILAEQQPVGRRVELKQEPVSPSSD